jgi:hypothetical protein
MCDAPQHRFTLNTNVRLWLCLFRVSCFFRLSIDDTLAGLEHMMTKDSHDMVQTVCWRSDESFLHDKPNLLSSNILCLYTYLVIANFRFIFLL